MANKTKKRFSTLSAIKKIEIKTKMTYNYIAIRITKTENHGNNKHW